MLVFKGNEERIHFSTENRSSSSKHNFSKNCLDSCGVEAYG